MPSEPIQEQELNTDAAGETPQPPDKKANKQVNAPETKPAKTAGSVAVPKKGGGEPPNRQKRPKPNKAVDGMARAAGRTNMGSGIGQLMYMLGFYAECKFVQIWRVLRVVFGLLAQVLVWAFGGILRSLGRFFRGIFRDLFAPFHRFFVGLRHVRAVHVEEKQKGSEDAQKKALRYFGSGVREHLYLVVNLLKFLMPIAAAFVFGFTVYSVLNLEYNLLVSVNGETLGIISDEATFEDARTIVRQRIVAAEDKGAESWLVVPEYRLTGSGRLTTKEQLVNNMLQSYEPGDEDALVEATGIVVDDELFVTNDGAAVNEFLEDLKDQYRVEGVEVDFVQEVEYSLDAEDLFFASSVRSAQDVIDALSGVVQEQLVYTASGEESLSDIAHNNGIPLATLLDYNPGLTFESDDEEEEPEEPEDEPEEEEYEPSGEYVPEGGTEIVVQPEQRRVQVFTSRIVYEEEVIPFTTHQEETTDLVKGQQQVQVEGADGLQRTPYEIITIDGVETKLPAEELEPEILQPAVDQYVLVGIYEFNYETSTGNDPNSQAYVWPLPDMTKVGRGMVAGHRGLDVNANEWAPIYAIDGGTVVEAGYHYSWGNTILIDHGNGITSRYAHCIQLNVEVGDEVTKGQNIAHVGNTGNSSGNHLHLEITVNGVLVEPLSVVSP